MYNVTEDDVQLLFHHRPHQSSILIVKRMKGFRRFSEILDVFPKNLITRKNLSLLTQLALRPKILCY